MKFVLLGVQRRVIRFPGRGVRGACVLTMPDGAGSQLSAARCPSSTVTCLSKGMYAQSKQFPSGPACILVVLCVCVWGGGRGGIAVS